MAWLTSNAHDGEHPGNCVAGDRYPGFETIQKMLYVFSILGHVATNPCFDIDEPTCVVRYRIHCSQFFRMQNEQGREDILRAFRHFKCIGQFDTFLMFLTVDKFRCYIVLRLKNYYYKFLLFFIFFFLNIDSFDSLKINIKIILRKIILLYGIQHFQR